jgi:hypothetical protein
MSTHVDISRAQLKLKAIADVLHRPLRDVLESGARVTATQMARSAQPFGTGANAYQLGLSAVRRDILKVYATPSRAYKDINDPHWSALFWKAFKATEFDVAQEVLQNYGHELRGVPLGPFDGGTAHRNARNRTTGRVTQRTPSLVVTDPDRIERYIAEIGKHVGFGKGGFADIARALGKSPRGLRAENDITANWILRHHGYGKFHHRAESDQQFIEIRNLVHYADQILNGSALAEAKRIGRERMIENLRITVQAETKKLRSAA